ncbi:hypothetical protein HK099_004247 [Clydaea vesicula]|uniref:26S proteasome non-ATPase regulatory subunit 10 n=1 Tax=Clydaea vesicula TaxID=447962 RepID=A0AAD5U0G5_9FUNG|nr:hypothetical protein HK099_004247 [Clydaea vesicula]
MTKAYEGFIHKFAFEGNVQSIKTLVEAEQNCINSKDEDKRTPLHSACSGGKSNVVEYLISMKVEVDAKDDADWTPLLIAASVGNLEIVEMLVKAGADINHQNEQGNTPLHYSCSKNRYEVVEYLLNSKADLGASNKLGQLPIHRAASLVGLLLDKGSKLNAKDNVWNTPLHLACESGFGETAKFLIERGADVEIQNKEKNTCFDVIGDNNLKKHLMLFVNG